MMRSDYDVSKASEETREAMRDRCEEQGHDWQNCCSAFFQAFLRGRWRGKERYFD